MSTSLYSSTAITITVARERSSTCFKSSLLTIAMTAAISLVGCGGGGSDTVATADTSVAAAISNALSQATQAVANLEATPHFHVALGNLNEPDGSGIYTYVGDGRPDARFVRRGDTLPELTVSADTAVTTTTPKAAGPQNPMVYAPADLHGAYKMPTLPTTLAGYTHLTPAQAAQYGAGQTIYLIDAYHDATALADLNLFSTKYNLPQCTQIAITKAAALPVARTDACDFGIAYVSATGAFTTTAPTANSQWLEEISLDLQMAHMAAPLARIVLIEGANSYLNVLAAGANLADTFGGPGVVSMSFGVPEYTYNAETVYDTWAFSGKNLSYVASAGDSGQQVNWPANSPNVIGVGGTTLTWTGTGTRSEVAWQGTGGGYSTTYLAPSWQSALTIPLLPKMSAGGQCVYCTNVRTRAVPDVAMVADPYSGVVITMKYNNVQYWLSFGGTSVGAPITAGIIAVGNATRAVANKAALGLFNANFYNETYSVANGAFSDVTTGNDCMVQCTATTITKDSAATGYDPVTGFGTPNVTTLISQMVAH